MDELFQICSKGLSSRPCRSHAPLRSLHRKIIPLKQSSIHIAIHTPLSPIVGARMAARGILTSHMLEKFIIAGITVSPTPTITPYATIEAANIGSAHASILRADMPSSCIPATGVRSFITGGAPIHRISPMNVITTIPNATVR